MVTKALQLNPTAAQGWYHTTVFYDLYLKGQHQKAIAVIREHPYHELAETQMKYAMAYGQLGQPDKAREHWEMCRQIEPEWSSQRMIEVFRLWNVNEPDIKRFMEGVAKAGLT